MYDKLVENNWATVFIDDINSGACLPTQDGKYKVRKVDTVESPWVFTNMPASETAGEICHRYHQYMFPKLGIIPMLCHNCYKVVVKPKTVVQLFALHDLQKQLNLPSKCGIELRSFVPSLYGGYFYNKGLEKGRDCYKLIRKRVNERISSDIEVLLKRGCTEFEMAFGNSDKWQININQKKLEDDFNARYVEESETTQLQTKDAINNIKISWVLFAAKKHDMTYKELTGGKLLVPECNYVTYHD